MYVLQRDVKCAISHPVPSGGLYSVCVHAFVSTSFAHTHSQKQTVVLYRKHVRPIIYFSVHTYPLDISVHTLHLHFYHTPRCVEGGNTGARYVICALGSGL